MRTHPGGGTVTRIVVVEDDPDLASLVAAWLESEARRVEQASIGPEALALVARTEPDLVILDLQLPGIDGLEVCRRLKAAADPPVVLILSGRHGKEARLEAYEAGADDFIAKPFEPDELLAKVDAMARTRQAERAARRQARRFEALATMGREVGATLDVDGVLARGATAARELLDAAEVDFRRIDWNCRELVVTATAREGGPVAAAERGGSERLTLDESTAGQAVLEGHSLTMPVRDLKARSAALEAQAFRGLLIVPLRSGERRLGALTALFRDRDVASDEDIRLAEAFADQASILLDHAELYEKQWAEAEVSAALLHVTRATATATSEEELLQRAADLALELFGADSCIPSMRDEASDSFRPMALAGDVTDDERVLFGETVFSPANHPILEQMVAAPRIMAIEDVGGAGAYPPTVLARARLRSTLAMPLMPSGRLIGVFALHWTTRTRQFSERDLRLAEGLSGVLGLGLERIRLFHEQKALEQRLAEAAKLRAIGTMASGVAHDFNNLLGMILGRAELARLALERGASRSDETIDALRAIEVAAEDGAQAVRRMQRFAQFDREVERTAVDLAEIVRGAVDPTRPRWRDEAQAAGRAVTLRTELAEGLVVEGNAAELREILVNLIFNAVDAMPTGGEIRIVTEPDGGQVRLAVHDSGQGMPDEVRRRCFEPFFTTKGPSGNGLGLAESWGIVRRHGGEIAVDSRPGGGTTFRISLPAATARPTESRADACPAGAAGLHVLVVDDEPALANILARALQALGHRSTVCTSGEEAIDRFDPAEHDLIMTDQGMPGLTGTGLAAVVKERSSATPVLLVTGWGGQMEETPPNVDTVVSKPYRIATIAQVLQEVVTPRSARRGAA